VIPSKFQRLHGTILLERMISSLFPYGLCFLKSSSGSENMVHDRWQEEQVA
ncbi:Hypothetical predicted protein, partial [Marmota monax]